MFDRSFIYSTIFLHAIRMFLDHGLQMYIMLFSNVSLWCRSNKHNEWSVSCGMPWDCGQNYEIAPSFLCCPLCFSSASCLCKQNWCRTCSDMAQQPMCNQLRYYFAWLCVTMTLLELRVTCGKIDAKRVQTWQN